MNKLLIDTIILRKPPDLLNGFRIVSLIVPEEHGIPADQPRLRIGFTVEDFDYLNMPEKEDDTLTITVTTDAAEKDGIVFQSTDYGATWEYKGLVQIAN